MPDTRPVETLDAHDLSALAETAEGILDKTLYVVKKRGQYIAVEEGDYEPTKGCVMKLFTSPTYADRKWPTVSVSSGDVNKVLEGCDAVFWRESSAEKLLWPYYYSQRLYGRKVASIRRHFKREKSILALLHTFPSHPDTVGDTKLLVQKDPNTLAVMTLPEFEEFMERNT